MSELDIHIAEDGSVTVSMPEVTTPLLVVAGLRSDYDYLDLGEFCLGSVFVSLRLARVVADNATRLALSRSSSPTGPSQAEE